MHTFKNPCFLTCLKHTSGATTKNLIIFTQTLNDKKATTFYCLCIPERKADAKDIKQSTQLHVPLRFPPNSITAARP